MKTNPSHELALHIVASQFAALGSEQRLGVLRVLVRAGQDGLSMGALGERSGVTGSTLTHHLKILVQAGLVTQTRRGRSMICAAIAYEEVLALSRYLLNDCCADCASSAESHDHG